MLAKELHFSTRIFLSSGCSRSPGLFSSARAGAELAVHPQHHLSLHFSPHSAWSPVEKGTSTARHGASSEKIDWTTGFVTPRRSRSRCRCASSRSVPRGKWGLGDRYHTAPLAGGTWIRVAGAGHCPFIQIQQHNCVNWFAHQSSPLFAWVQWIGSNNTTCPLC